MFNWQIRFAYEKRKLGALIKKFVKKDRALISIRNLFKDIIGSLYS